VLDTDQCLSVPELKRGLRRPVLRPENDRSACAVPERAVNRVPSLYVNRPRDRRNPRSASGFERISRKEAEADVTPEIGSTSWGSLVRAQYRTAKKPCTRAFLLLKQATAGKAVARNRCAIEARSFPCEGPYPRGGSPVKDRTPGNKRLSQHWPRRPSSQKSAVGTGAPAGLIGGQLLRAVKTGERPRGHGLS
jgi:hypothetical protein